MTKQTQMADTLLDVRGLVAGYRNVSVLDGLALSVRVGRIVAVIGPNGAGKSTLLNTLMGLLPVAGGTIRFGGQDIAVLDTEERVGRGMGLVTEQRNLFGTMSVRDNLWLGSYIRKRSGNRDRLFETVYALFPRLRERQLQRADTLSGGERQMLALARAFLARPRLLMLDEPSLGLAPLVVRDILNTIAVLRDEGISVLLVEQNARAALRIADQGYVLENGRIVNEGAAASLLNDPAVIDSYLGGTTRRQVAGGDDQEREGSA